MIARPVIGISEGLADYGDYYGFGYGRPLLAAGALPVLLPYYERPEDRIELIERLDGLVLAGGRDIEAWRYGRAEPHPEHLPGLPHLDEIDLHYARLAVEGAVPLLGICRGVQVLNVGLGGTLYQDLATDRPAPLGHDQNLGESPRPRTEPHHSVAVRPGSCLAEVLGLQEIEVNSLHHQGIKTLAGPLTPVAHAPDGLVEAVEPADPARWTFLVGVQWHPEELCRGGHGPSRRLFERFVAAAAKRAHR